MNSLLYDEHRPGHRRMSIHFRRAVVTGLLPPLIAGFLALGESAPGPGLPAAAGLSLAGLLLLQGARGLPREPRLTRPARALAASSERWFPAALVMMQGLFNALTVLILWFTVADLGFPAATWQHLLLIIWLALAPVRKVLDGAAPRDMPTPYELLTETLRYVNAALFAVLLAGIFSRTVLPPGQRMTESVPPVVVLIWVPAVLVVIGALVLLIDHILRKMPPPAGTETRDTLD